MIDYFERILVDFGTQNGTKLDPKWDQKSISTSTCEFSKIIEKPKENQYFWGSKGSKLGPKIDQKSIPKATEKPTERHCEKRDEKNLKNQRNRCKKLEKIRRNLKTMVFHWF